MYPKPKDVGLARAVLWWVVATGGGVLLLFTPMIAFDVSMKWLLLILPLLLAWFTWLTLEYMRWGWGRRRR